MHELQRLLCFVFFVVAAEDEVLLKQGYEVLQHVLIARSLLQDVLISVRVVELNIIAISFSYVRA